MSKIVDSSLIASVTRMRTAKTSMVKNTASLAKVAEPLAKYVGRRLIRPIADVYASSFEFSAAAASLVNDAAQAVTAVLTTRDADLPSIEDVEATIEAIGEEPDASANKRASRRAAKRAKQAANRRVDDAPSPEGADAAREHLHGAEPSAETGEKKMVN